jgi:FkbM family methyltransferase
MPRSKLVDKITRRILYRLPRHSYLLDAAVTYIDFYMNDNNYRPLDNGEIHAMRNALKPDGKVTVFDVGANVGDWTEHVIAHNPQAIVHCFEPSPNALAQLRARGFPPQVIINPIGLGERRETREFTMARTRSVFSSLYPGSVDDEAVEKVTIALDTVDEYCAQHQIAYIDYLKIDVEGHDLAVLRGAAKMLSEGRIRYAHFEYGHHWIYARAFLLDAFEFAEAVNCDVYKIMPKGLKHYEQYSRSLERFRGAYFVLRPRKAL